MAWLFRRLGSLESLESLGNIRESSLISLISLNSLLNRGCVRCSDSAEKWRNGRVGQFCALNLTIC